MVILEKKGNAKEMVQQKAFILINGSAPWNETSWLDGNLLRNRNTSPLKKPHVDIILFIMPKIES